MTERIQRVMVVTAHPDDSEFGAGARSPSSYGRASM